MPLAWARAARETGKTLLNLKLAPKIVLKAGRRTRKSSSIAVCLINRANTGKRAGVTTTGKHFEEFASEFVCAVLSSLRKEGR